MPEPASAASRSEATEGRILDAAEVLFARSGLRGTRVREIALAAGVSPGALYIYFPSKTALYQAVLDRGLQPVAAILDEFGPDRAPPPLETLIGRLLQHLAEHPSLSRLVYLEALSEGPFLAHLARTWFRPLLDLDVSTYLVQQIKMIEAAAIGSNDRVRPPRLPLVGEHRARVEKTIADALATRPALPASG